MAFFYNPFNCKCDYLNFASIQLLNFLVAEEENIEDSYAAEMRF